MEVVSRRPMGFEKYGEQFIVTAIFVMLCANITILLKLICCCPDGYGKLLSKHVQTCCMVETFMQTP